MVKKRLYIDLEICSDCKECTAGCSYVFHPDNIGITSIIEYATFALICRRCEDPACVKSCPKDALEKQEDGTLKRYTMRCVSCQSCAIACPFGTIYAEIVPYLSSRCDICLESGLSEFKLPKCIESCPKGAIQYKETEESKEKNIYLLGNYLAVRAIAWKREAPVKGAL